MSTNTVTLTTPLKRGDTEITQITLHKPNAGALRGVSLRACLDMETDAVCTVVPRISDPKITPQEMATAIEAPDLLQLGAALAGFLLPPSVMAEAAKNFESQSE
jgi:hypothetical protein